jgi:hypothetical protein
MAMMSWQYVAGFFDGEGCIRIAQGSCTISPQISLYQSRPRGFVLLTEIQEFLALHEITARMNKQREYQTERSGTQMMFRLYIYRRVDALAFIERIFPFLRIKKVECPDIYRWLRIYPIIPSSDFHTGFRKGKLLPPERLVCSKGHVLTNDNIYFLRQPSKRRPFWKDCKQCRIEARMEHYRTVTKPIMAAYGLGMRDVNADVIAKARQEGVIA